LFRVNPSAPLANSLFGRGRPHVWAHPDGGPVMYIYVYIHLHMYIHIIHMYIHIYIHKYIYIYYRHLDPNSVLCRRPHVCAHPDGGAVTYIYVYICLHMYIHIIHLYIYIHIYTKGTWIRFTLLLRTPSCLVAPRRRSGHIYIYTFTYVDTYTYIFI